jgi:hypothetical protein
MFSVSLDPDGHSAIHQPAALDLDKVGFDYVERGVRNLVETLWRFNYHAVCSCAGHEDDLEPYPWIVIPIDIAENPNKLSKLAEAVARYNMTLAESGHLPTATNVWILLPLFGPSGEFVIYLHPLDTNPERTPRRISELRKSADALASFLKWNCGNLFSSAPSDKQ